jgi:uncharacterized protein (DUF849 family)
VVDAGAEALHLHPRNAQGAQSLAAGDIAAALQAVRASCPQTPVGVSTGLWIEDTVERRLERIREWDVLPDFTGVNFYEPGAVELCTLFQERGVGIEAGLRSVEDVLLLLNTGLASGCLRLLVEPYEAEPGAALHIAQEMVTHLNVAGVQCPLLLHGFEQTAWPLLEAACQRGYDTRIGFEDALTLPDGSLACSNADLVAVAVERAKHYRH